MYDEYKNKTKERGSAFVKLRRLLASAAMGIFMLSVLTGCTTAEQNKTTAAEGLDELGMITVIAREEGSGTREVFAESLGFYDGSTGRDCTTGDARWAENGNEVIDLVAEDEAAIGYVSAGMLKDEDKKNLHTVTVDGSDLERSFYLAYSGKLSELELDFLTYVESAGQEIVGKNYTTVGKVTSFLSGKPTGNIKIGGSSSVFGLMQELADAYMKQNPNAFIEVIKTDSTNGLTGAMSGIYDFGMASRDLKDYEKQLLEYEVIAKDE